MTGLWVFIGIILFFLLLGQIRLGGSVEYCKEGITAQVKFGPLRITVYPPKEKEKKKETPQKKPKEEKSKEKRGGTFALLMELLPVGLKAVGTLLRKLRIDELTLYLTWADDDPASAAMGYGAANAAMGMLYPALDHNFIIKKSDVRIAVSMEAGKPEVYLNAALTLTLGQLLSLILYFGLRAGIIFIKNRRAHPPRTGKKKEAVTNE